MSAVANSEQNFSEYVVIGGGLSGLLLALKLSKDPKKITKGITLIEKEAQLGGRFFYTQLNQFSGKSRSQVFSELYESASRNQYLSGLGFEFLNADALEIIYRHFLSQLSEEEINHIENMQVKLDVKDEKYASERNLFFVKKDFISENELFNSSSEFFTKKEAESFKILLNYSLEDEFQNETILFEKSKYWLELPKSVKDTFSPFFQTIIGPNWEKTRFVIVQRKIRDFFNNYQKKVPSYFYRSYCFEYLIGNILIKRGVNIRNLCELIRVQKNEKNIFHLLLSDDLNPNDKNLECSKIIFAMPLNNCLGIIAKEHFSPSQSKFISKVRPISLVISEIINFSEIKNDQWPTNIKADDCLVFPVERSIGYLTNDQRFLVTTKLDYEDSLQAPAVREAISRLRKATCRVIKPEFIDELKKGARIPQKKILERIILLPVAYTIPNDIPVNIEVKEIKMGLEGMFCCGDTFPGIADEPWKMIVNSVNEVFANLS
ncbi:NAD(P)-binding protein [Pigmentibacter sp. JX0631]|uniref:NAD(P)-binding protein n=1 Tax=Pigmentibacter sp. JX0631 TaxID=2976982 RepID=UPI002469AAAE|nr:NAD(P)-binding protein [Pigmentibacter sp. JX0631]WGL59487.1 NAD(P)-binding protein [Pigmentibacter sp. JX0631]